MTFKELEKMTAGKTFPLSAENVDGEPVVIECGKDNDLRFFKLSTAQTNNWLRVNYIWEDGTTEELFEK